MKTQMLSLARRHFCRSYIPVSTQRHNIRQWARSVRLLGSKWLLAEHINCTGKQP